MNQYLLLRNNQQSGPYTVEELVSKGLKAYDLVWLEGKSAAWRYPSELDELKSFAPAVEEQPFDRFYKKNSSVNVVSNIENEKKSGATVKSIDEKIAKQLPDKSKKVYVTFPGKNASQNISNNQHPSFLNENNNSESGNGSVDKKVNAQAQTPVIPIEDAVKSSPGFSSILEEKLNTHENSVIPIIQNRPPGNVVLKVIVAVCLLMVGLLIGLVINNSKQKANIRKLNTLVDQIQQKEKEKNRTTLKQQQSSFPAIDVPQDQPTSAVDSVQTAQLIPIEKKSNTVKKDIASSKRKNQLPNVAANAEIKVEESPASVNLEQPKKSEISLETARKNLRQQISVQSNKYKTGLFGGISDLKLVLSNKSEFQLDRVEVEIHYLGPEKKIVKTQTVVFEHVSPGKQITLDIPKSNRGVSIDYSVKNINSKELVLAHSNM